MRDENNWGILTRLYPVYLIECYPQDLDKSRKKQPGCWSSPCSNQRQDISGRAKRVTRGLCRGTAQKRLTEEQTEVQICKEWRNMSQHSSRIHPLASTARRERGIYSQADGPRIERERKQLNREIINDMVYLLDILHIQQEGPHPLQIFFAAYLPQARKVSQPRDALTLNTIQEINRTKRQFDTQRWRFSGEKEINRKTNREWTQYRKKVNPGTIHYPNNESTGQGWHQGHADGKEKGRGHGPEKTESRKIEVKIGYVFM